MPLPLRSFGLALWLALGLVLFTLLTATAQPPRSAGFSPRTIALVNGRIIVSPEQEIPVGTIVVRDGLIIAVGAEVQPPADAEVIDIRDHIVHSGFIDAASSTLIDPKKIPTVDEGRPPETSRYALAGTLLDNRKGLSPEFSPREALRNDPSLLEARRRAAFTSTHIVPTGRIASGSGLLIANSGLPLRESLLTEETFPQFHLHALGGTGYPATLMGVTAHLRQALLDADRFQTHTRLYSERTAGIPRPPLDPVLSSLASVRTAGKPTLFVAQNRDEIHRALDFAHEHQLAVILVGGAEAWRATDRIKSETRGVITYINWGDSPRVEIEPNAEKLDPKQRDPRAVQQDRVDRWQSQVKNLKQLHAAGIRFAIATEGLNAPADMTRAVKQAIEAGLPREAALAALTRNPAELLGLGSRLGTLETGKLAHLVVSTGPFEDERSRVRHVFIDGAHFEYNTDAKPVPPPSAPPAPQAALAGNWNFEVEVGETRWNATAEVIQNGATLTGLFRSPQGDGKISQGKVAGRHVELTVAIGAGAQSIELKIVADVDEQNPQQLSGTLASAFGTPVKLTARKASTPESAGSTIGTLTIDDRNNETADNLNQQPVELESDRARRSLPTGGNVLIRNATVLTGIGPPLAGHSILVRQGKIAAIAPNIEPDAGMVVIDATGRFVASGIIDTHSHIMFPEGLGGVNEATASIVPEVRVRDVVRSEDPAAYRALAGGVTAIRMLHGSANVVGGQDAVVKLKYGQLSREQLLNGNPQGVKFALGENVKRQRGRFPNTRLGVEATLNRAFLEALDYRREWHVYEKAAADQKAAGQPVTLLPPRRDLRLDALADIIEHQKFIHSHCYRADEILMLLRVTSSLGIRVWSLQHVLEGYKIAPEIAAHGASCSTFGDWWAYKIEAFDATPYNAALLHEAGVNVVLKSDDAELMRHLYIEAAKMIRYGNVSPETAWRMVTLNAARELGLADRMGSLEVGKDGDMVIYSGHPLSIFSRCEVTLIEGEPFFVREKQPSTMTPAAAARTAQPPAWSIPAVDVRLKQLELEKAKSGTYAIVGATIHPQDGPAIPNGTLLVHGEHIAAVGATVTIPAGTPVIDAQGLSVYPGLIDAGSILGLQEIGSADETKDYNESGSLQPDLRAGVAVNPDSELIPVARAGGITTSLIRPAGALIGGQSSWIQLAGWTVPEMVRELEVALQIDWPGSSDSNAEVATLSKLFKEARTYLKLKDQAKASNAPAPIVDPRFEALAPYLNRTKKVHIEADSRKQIAEALLFAEKENIAIVITGGAEAWKLANELKKRDVPVIIGAVMSRPFTQYDPYDSAYANASRLHDAGVLFSIRSNAGGTAGFSASNARNAPFEAGLSVAFGLPEEAGVKSVTINAARILGIDQKTGSLSAGKLADFVVTDGSPLQPATQYKGIFIAGKAHTSESRHTRLYERYRGRLHEVQKK